MSERNRRSAGDTHSNRATPHAPADERGLDEWLGRRRAEIDALLEQRLRLPATADDPGRLLEALRYSLLAPGKRLRPLLALAAAEAVGAPVDETVLTAAATVELVHCYSLIHDDLPSMDDDDFRRGKPSNHKVFGEAVAILAGDALLTLAFEWLADAGERSGRHAALGRAALALARGAGPAGMVRGQARDIAGLASTSVEAIEKLHGEKTAALFRAAVEIGAAAAGAGPATIEALGRFGFSYGIAFQYVDDLADGDRPEMAEAARQRALHWLSQSRAVLADVPTLADSSVLRGLADRLARQG